MLSVERLKEFLDYNPETGIFTRKEKGLRTNPGDVAGTPDSSGYLQIRIDGGIYRSHRLAWLYYYGVEPKHFIDHRNGVKSDNRIDNLRACDNSDNMRNRGSTKRNKLGVKGVYFRKDLGKYQATIKLKGKTRYLGLFDTVEQAKAAWDAVAREHHGEFFKS